MATNSDTEKVIHEILEAKTDDELRACFPVIKVLRPHIPNSQSLIESYRIQEKEGLHIMYIKDKINDSDPEPVVVSIMSYRILHCFFYGRQMYVNDLCTLPTAKRKGYAGQLLDWVTEESKKEKCDVVTLDSGYTRTDAHRLYMNKRFFTKAHHFCLELEHDSWKQ